ncbi:MAG: 2-hydroxyglutaryl-CoA dehydratase [Deltaproteobacteria bacterium]|nr:2-hydroxyglutaryl-CoA dehydratase [Deltaproteobacteria bacterium]
MGIDVGSTTTKGVLLGDDGALLECVLEPTAPRIDEQSREVVARLKQKGGELPVGATGYGRKRVPTARAVTEITCHAKGAFFRLKRQGLLVDIGGQDTKVIHLGAQGDVQDFSMNDKCAAGTGRFLEVILGRLNVPLAEVSAYAARAPRVVSISSTCTVFAESEVVSLIAEGEPVEGIVKGLHASLASRVRAQAGTLSPSAEIFMSGGVALNQAMVAALAQAMGRAITVLPEPQLIGALGAALSVAG